jgi:hypothetical protein
MTKAPLQMRQPIDTETRRLIAGIGRPDRHVRLFCQILAGAILAVIVNKQEVIDAEITVILHEEGQPDPFIPNGRKQQNRLGRDPRRAVGNNGQFAAAQKATQMGPASTRAQSDCPDNTQPIPPMPPGILRLLVS